MKTLSFKTLMALIYLVAISSMAIGCTEDDEFDNFDDFGASTSCSSPDDEGECWGPDTGIPVTDTDEPDWPDTGTSWPDTDWPDTDTSWPDDDFCWMAFDECIESCDLQIDEPTDPTDCGCEPGNWACDCMIVSPEDCLWTCEVEFNDCLTPYEKPCEQQLGECLESCEYQDTDPNWDNDYDCACACIEGGDCDCDCGMPDIYSCQDECYWMYDDCQTPPVLDCNSEYHNCLDTCAWDDEWCHDMCYDDFYYCNLNQGIEHCDGEYDFCTDMCAWDDHFCYEHCYEQFYDCMENGSNGYCETYCDQWGCWEECWGQGSECERVCNEWECWEECWDTDTAPQGRGL